jgi:PPOX class probable F420-dependent enzyme
MTDLPAAVLDRLEDELTAWLCTLRTDGSPHVTPIWFVYRSGTWWVGSDERNWKVRNIDADPRVSLALENGTDPVVAEGAALLHRHEFPADIVTAFAAKYQGWDITRITAGGGGRVLLEIPTVHWLLAGTAQ